MIARQIQTEFRHFKNSGLKRDVTGNGFEIRSNRQSETNREDMIKTETRDVPSLKEGPRRAPRPDEQDL
jgi:hypothetical protein